MEFNSVDSSSSIEEWRRSVDKTLKYYKDKIKHIKSTNKSRTKNSTIQWQREKRVLNNKIKALQNKNDELQESFNEQKYVLRNEIRSLQRKLKAAEPQRNLVESEKEEETERSESEYEGDDNYYNVNIHKIFDYGANYSAANNKDSAQSKEQNEIHNITAKHAQRLQKWNKNTQILSDSCHGISTTNSPRKRHGKPLVAQYSELKAVMADQESKMDEISHFVSDLIAQKRRLKRLVEKHEAELPRRNHLFRESFMEYDKMREIRKRLYDNLMESVDRLNDAIDDENEMNERQCKLYASYHRLSDDLKELKSNLNRCSLLIKNYQTFDEVNDSKIKEMDSYFRSKWIRFRKCWFRWTYKEIIYWIRYLVAEKKLVLSSSINLDQVQRALADAGVNGSWFERLSKNDLKQIGFAVYNDRKELYDKIQELVTEHPNVTSYNFGAEGQFETTSGAEDGQSGKVQIPSQFLCPITKKIMKEPVQIFDDYSYERNSILAYLAKHKRSPITNEACDSEDECMVLPNRKLSQQIQTFLRVNPQLCDGNTQR